MRPGGSASIWRSRRIDARASTIRGATPPCRCGFTTRKPRSRGSWSRPRGGRSTASWRSATGPSGLPPARPPRSGCRAIRPMPRGRAPTRRRRASGSRPPAFPHRGSWSCPSRATRPSGRGSPTRASSSRSGCREVAASSAPIRGQTSTRPCRGSARCWREGTSAHCVPASTAPCSSRATWTVRNTRSRGCSPAADSGGSRFSRSRIRSMARFSRRPST